MSLALVTPVVLTFNEEENVGRVLESLRAFRRVVVVDSLSNDRTETIARAFPNVAWFSRPWEGFREQWRFAFEETATTTPFILALDADMRVPPELEIEIATTAAHGEVDGATMAFEYQIRGMPLPGSLYPRQLRLLRISKACVGERGHAHLLSVEGRVVDLTARLVHDDWKPLEMFVRAQVGYSARELPGILDGTSPGIPALVRRWLPLTPIAVWAWAWIRAGGPFGGAAARRYALERLMYEAMLQWRIDDRRLLERGDRNPVRRRASP